MQLLIDFFPIIVFFVAYRVYDIYAATAALIVAMAIQIAYMWVRHRKVNTMLLVSGALAAVFGGITLAVHDPVFLKWKFTVVYWLFAAAFLASRWIGDKTITERIMGEAIQLDATFWRQLNWMWVASFFILGALNLYVMYNFDEATWVNFKVFGGIGLTLLTALAQGVWISLRLRTQPAEEAPKVPAAEIEASRGNQ